MAVTWTAHSPAFGGYYENARLAGRFLTIRQTPAGRWVARVDSVKLRGSFQSAEATKAAAARGTAGATADTAGLAEAIRRLEIVAARDTPVQVAFTPGQAELTAGSGDGVSGADTVACELDGDPITVAFSPRLLLDAITATGGGRTRIALTGPATPALITPASADDGTGASYRHLLMPIRGAS